MIKSVLATLTVGLLTTSLAFAEATPSGGGSGGNNGATPSLPPTTSSTADAATTAPTPVAPAVLALTNAVNTPAAAKNPSIAKAAVADAIAALPADATDAEKEALVQAALDAAPTKAVENAILEAAAEAGVVLP